LESSFALSVIATSISISNGDAGDPMLTGEIKLLVRKGRGLMNSLETEDMNGLASPMIVEVMDGQDARIWMSETRSAIDGK